VRPLTAVAVLGAVLVLGGCGSSGNGWHAFAKRTTEGTQIGAAGGTIENPGAVEVKVDAKPDVKTQVNYSIDCSGGTHPSTGLANGRTPFTTPVPLPGGRQPCSVSASASKSQPSKMTVTLLSRAAGGGR
jgi:hypothetical protein